MTQHDDDPPVAGAGVSPAPANRHPAARRRRAVVGAVGVAAVLGAGIWAMAAQREDGGHMTAQHQPDVPVPVVPAAPPEPAASSAPAAAPAPRTASASAVPVTGPASSSKAVVRRPAPAKPASTDSAKVRKKIQAAREAAERDGRPLQRPLKPRADAVVAGLTTRTERTAAGTVRITTAKGDLTGQGDQLMAADGGRAAGRARCTQNVRFSENAAPRRIPTVLLCWRTSAARSVVTLAVVRKGTPAAAASAAVIDREWARLG